jgi:voltage-gated potassium channel
MNDRNRNFNAELYRPRQDSPRRPSVALYLAGVAAIFFFGSAGYSLIEGWSLFDSFYMTVITLATIGYGETHPLTTSGRAFTILLIFIGLGLGTVLLGSAWQSLVEAQLNRMFDRRRKMLDRIEKLAGHTIFCGYSRLGKQAAIELSYSGVQVVVIETSDVRAADAEDAGFLVVRGDATLEETMRAAGIERANRIVSLLPRDSDNLYVILTAREISSSIHIVARSEDEVGEKRLRRAGADQLISTFSLAARKLADGLLRPQITEFFEVAGTGKDGWKIEEIRIPPTSPVCGQSLKQLSLRQTAKVGIAAVVSQSGELEINPDGATLLEAGSVLIAIGWKRDLETLERSILPEAT